MERRALFADRRDAGRRLAGLCRPLVDAAHTVVLALPRGGVPVGDEIARALKVPLDVCNVRKLGVPGQEELAMGALASGGAVVINAGVLAELDIPPAVVDAAIAEQRAEIERRDALFRGSRTAVPIAGATVVLVDDGLATGATMRAAAIALRRLAPARILAAVPVAARESADLVRRDVDALVCLAQPEPFYGVGRWYRRFPQLTDDDVRTILDRR
jgi:putative phosphoribosyl transferase